MPITPTQAQITGIERNRRERDENLVAEDNDATIP